MVSSVSLRCYYLVQTLPADDEAEVVLWITSTAESFEDAWIYGHRASARPQRAC